MAPDVVRAELTEGESAIFKEKCEDVVADKLHSEGINGGAMGKHSSPAVPSSASSASGNGNFGASQDAVQAEPRSPEQAIMMEQSEDLIAPRANLELSMREDVPVQDSLPASPPIPGLDLNAEPLCGHEWEATPGHHKMTQDTANAEGTKRESSILQVRFENAEAQNSDAKTFRGDAVREHASFPVPSTASEFVSSHTPSSGHEMEATPGHAQMSHGDVQAEPKSLEATIVEEQCEDAILRKTHTEVFIEAPCRTQLDLDQDDDAESATGGNQDVSPGAVASQVYTEVATLLHDERQEDLTVAALTSDPIQAGDQEQPMLGAMAIDPCKPDDQTVQTLAAVAANRIHPTAIIQYVDPIDIMPAAREADLGQASPAATITWLDNQEGSTSAATSLYLEELLPEPSLIKEHGLRTCADAAIESLDEEVAHITEDESESDEDCTQQTPKFQPHVEESELEGKKHLVTHVEHVQEQEGDELEGDEKQEGGNWCDEQEEVKENTRVQPQVVDGQEEHRSQLEPSIPRAPHIVSPPTSNPASNNLDGMQSASMLNPVEAALALRGSTHLQTAEGNVASHVSPAPIAPPTSSAVDTTALDKLQLLPPKLMQIAHTKRRLVGKQSPEEQPRKLRKQLVRHQPLRSGSEIVRSSLGHSLRPAEQGCTVRVRGDGWGRLDGGYMATVTEADEFSFTVIRQGDHWEESQVLREYCILNPHPELQPECGYLSKSASQSKRRRK